MVRKMNKTIDIQQLYKLFFSKNLSEISIGTPRTPPRPSSNPSSNPNANQSPNKGLFFTPMSKSIYDTMSPQSKPYMLADMLLNNRTIDDMNEAAEFIDPDYQEKMTNNGLGFYMEDFISYYCVCPVCGQFSLRKYAHSNVPVVDMICINKKYHLEKNECFIFQIKTSLSTSYFNLKKNEITVGSINYGKPSHIHSGSESILHKIVVPGYFCIKLNSIDENNQSFTIDQKNSFIIYPNYNNQSNSTYYSYTGLVDRFNKSIIKWDPSMFTKKLISDVTTVNRIDYEFFVEEELENPYTNLVNLIK